MSERVEKFTHGDIVTHATRPGWFGIRTVSKTVYSDGVEYVRFWEGGSYPVASLVFARGEARAGGAE